MKNTKAYTNLAVWKESLELVKSTYILISIFPEIEAKTIIDRLKSQVIEIPIGISKGMQTEDLNERQIMLKKSQSALNEIETLLIIAQKLDFITDTDVNKFNEKNEPIAMNIKGLILKFNPDKT